MLDYRDDEKRIGFARRIVFRGKLVFARENQELYQRNRRRETFFFLYLSLILFFTRVFLLECSLSLLLHIYT
jgi:hypothetical protein